MKTVAVDFETFYDTKRGIGVRDLGLWHYVRHPEFDAYLVSVYGDGIEFVGHPSDFDWASIKKFTWLSHNAGFDMGVFMAHSESWSVDWLPKNWWCTASLAAYLQAPRNLAGAAQQLLGLEVSKDVRTQLDGQSAYDIFSDLAGFGEEVKEYALEDAKICYQLWQKFSDQWPEYERHLARLTAAAGMIGVAINAELAETNLQKLRKIYHDACVALPWVWEAGVGEAKALSPKALAKHCREQGIKPPPSLNENDSRCAAWEEKHGQKIPWVAAMRRVRKSNLLMKKLEDMLARTRSVDGRMGYDMFYFGVPHTGRWIASGRWNIQNLPREPFEGVSLRNCLRAAKGKKLLIAALAQIEPRCLAWLAQADKFLEVLRSGIDVYEAYARASGQWKNKAQLKNADPALRQKCKAEVLGLGYGMGPARYKEYAAAFGLELSMGEAKRAVADFKRANPHVPMLWRRLENLLQSALGGDFEMTLPSSRIIRYFEVRRDGRELSACVVRGERRRRLWGGVLVENLVQAMARDVFAEAMLQIHESGAARVLFHVHDEVVCEIEAEQAKEAADAIKSILCTPPEWASDLPLDAEVQISDFYAK